MSIHVHNFLLSKYLLHIYLGAEFWITGCAFVQFKCLLPKGSPKLLYQLTFPLTVYEICSYDSLSLVLAIFLILDFLEGVEWYLIVVLICISLVTNEVENIFICWWQFGCALLLSAHVSLLQCFLICFFFAMFSVSFSYQFVGISLCMYCVCPLLVYVLQISAPILWLAFSLS